MLLSDIITKDKIIMSVKNNNRDSVINEMVKHLHSLGLVNDIDEFVKKIIERENIESTGIGDGIALPHARGEVKKIAVILGISKEGVDFNSIDKKPVHLIFLIAAPNDVKKEYLQVIAKIAKMLKTKNYKEELINAKNVDDVMNVIYTFDEKFPVEMKVKTKNGRSVFKPEEKK